jgi:hypothetical protein
MQAMGRAWVTSVVALLVLTSIPARAASLRAGAAKVVITPKVGAGKVYLAGFGNNRLATGVHDDLFARCLALSAGEKTLVLCAADLIGLFNDDVLKIRGLVKARAPQVTHVIVASTHDHAGPDTMGLWGATHFESGIDEKYLDWLDERIAACAVESVGALEDAQLTLARDDHPLLALLQDDSRPPYVKDPHLFAMRLVSAGGKPIATLVNWTDHPETLGGKNTQITADYPHWMYRRVEEHLGGTALFFNGSVGGLISTLGDQVALQDPETGQIAKDHTWRKAELFGNLIGELAVRALASGEPAAVDSLVIRKAAIFVPLENDRFRIANANGIFKGRKPLFTEGKLDASVSEKEFPGSGVLKYSTGKEMQTEVDYVRLLAQGRAVAEIATIPGEAYPELTNGGITRYPGADFPDAPFEPTLRDHMISRYKFVFGLGNDEIGYIIPKAEWDNKPPWLKNAAERWYGEINSTGPEAAGVVMKALVGLITGN